MVSRAAGAAGASRHLAGGGGTYQPIRAGVLLSSSVIVDGSRSLLSFREDPATFRSPQRTSEKTPCRQLSE